MLLLKAMRGEETPRPAWVPFVGTHGGFLAGVTAGEYLQSSRNIIAGLEKAKTLYRPDGLPVLFDLQLEAEILGCSLHWADDGPPSVMDHPLENGAIADLPVFSTDRGRFPVVSEAMAALKKSIGGDTALYGLITGPFTLAMHLRGNEIFIDMYEDKEAVARLLEFCLEIGRRTADFYLDHGADVIAVVDPMTSQISPAHFEGFMASGLDHLFAHIRSRGGMSSLFVCGDATRNLEMMAQTGCDNLSIDENISLASLRRLAEKHGKSFGGNLKLTTVLLLGAESDSRMDAIRCMDEAGTRGFILAPGCDLPFSVPPGNLQAVAAMVHDSYRREVARRTLKLNGEDSFDDIPRVDYDTWDRIRVDVVTLNSAACAPYQYMVQAAREAAKSVDDPIEVVEHKITTREGLAAMSRLGVSAIPSICIQGKPCFASIIPRKEELVKAIEECRQEQKAGVGDTV